MPLLVFVFSMGVIYTVRKARGIIHSFSIFEENFRKIKKARESVLSEIRGLFY